MERINLTENITLNVFDLAKFKSVVMEIRLANTLNERRATLRSLLALMLGDRSRLYDTKAKMNQALDELYGAALTIKNSRFGRAAVLRIAIKTINQRYAHDQLMIQQLTFINEILFHPLLTEIVFKEAVVDLRNELLRVQEDPRELALNLALRQAGDGGPLSINPLGRINILDQLTLDDVISEYETMINEDLIVINVAGDLKGTDVVTLCRKYLAFKPRAVTIDTYYMINTVADRYAEVVKDVQQGSLLMIYNADTAIVDPLYWALKLGSIILGQLPISLLFQEVREKRSLCYYIYSAVMSFDGALIINTGIDDANADLARQLIGEQVANICDAAYADELLAAAKEMLLSSLDRIDDDISDILNFAYQSQLQDDPFTLEQIKTIITEVERSDITRVFKRLVLNTTFRLKKRGN